jgi:hypothetical protein
MWRTLKEYAMDTGQFQQRVERIEQCADEAVKAMKQAGDAPDELRQCVTRLHEQARQLRAEARQASDQTQLSGSVDSLEQTGDRAKAACRGAGNRVDPQLQSAVMKAHDEISGLKKQMH